MASKPKSSSGFTLIEMVVALAVLILLIMTLMGSWRNQINKARDAQRKEDLTRLRTAMEEYYNDHECYPNADILELCQSDSLDPYLNKIPCDPTTKLPYCYIPEEDDCPQSFRLLAHLQNQTDPDTTKLGCYESDPFCGWEDNCADPGSYYTGFNYGVSTSNITVANPDLPSPTPTPIASPTTSPSPAVSPTTSPSPTPLPSPSPSPGNYACTPSGVCNSYADTSTCGVTFADYKICNNYCPTSSLEERCAY